VRQLETEDGSRDDEFQRVVAMATRRHTGEVLMNRYAVRGSVYSGSVYWRQASSSHYFTTPIPGKSLFHLAATSNVTIGRLQA